MSTAIQMQFGPSQFENSREELLKLKQSLSIGSYFDEFNGMDDALLLDCFVGGLHPELKREVKSRSLMSLMQAVSLAKLFEQKYLLNLQGGKFTLPPSILTPNCVNHNSDAKATPLVTPIKALPPLLPTPSKLGSIHKLSPAEIQFRREKGHCFTCDDKFLPNHKCKSKHYFLIQSIEEIPIESEQMEETTLSEFPTLLIEPTVDTPHHLSYNAMTGMPTRRSIHFQGFVCGRTLCILMDGGNFDNFIHPAMAQRLNIIIDATPPFMVQVGSGELLQCEGEMCDIPVTIQGNMLLIITFVLPIATEELVVRDIWLKTLDTHMVNYKEKFITFFDKGRLIKLRGENNEAPTQAQFYQLKRLYDTKEIAAFYTLQWQAVEESQQGRIEMPLHTPT